MSSPSSPQSASLATSRQSDQQGAIFALLTIAGIILYVIIDVIAQLLPPHYSVIRQPESDLAVGSYGWLMTINFLIRGLLSFALIAGLAKGTTAAARSRAGLILLGIWAAGALLLALFPTDLAGERVTLHGAIHLLVAVIAFLCAAVGEIIISRRFAADAAWRSFSRPALTLAVLALIVCLLTLAGGAVPGLKHIPGLTERLFLGLALLWMLVMALRLRSLPATRAARH
jgi:hypothetical membrane protein